jgi:hypothetical protein
VISLAGIVLPIPVNLHRVGVPLRERIFVSGLYGTADAKIDRQRQHDGTSCSSANLGVIARTIVHHDDGRAGHMLTNCENHFLN